MGSVAVAVVEFDEAVQSPWRPPLVSVDRGRRGTPAPVASVHVRSRVGACRPVDAAASSVPSRHTAVRPGAAPGRSAEAGFSPPGRTRFADRSYARGRRDVPGVRLTRRARRLGAALGLVVGVALGAWLGAALGGDRDGGLELAGETSVVVRSGDSVWSIARSIAGESDVRAVVDAIQGLNGLEGEPLLPGQVLRLP